MKKIPIAFVLLAGAFVLAGCVEDYNDFRDSGYYSTYSNNGDYKHHRRHSNYPSSSGYYSSQTPAAPINHSPRANGGYYSTGSGVSYPNRSNVPPANNGYYSSSGNSNHYISPANNGYTSGYTSSGGDLPHPTRPAQPVVVHHAKNANHSEGKGLFGKMFGEIKQDMKKQVPNKTNNANNANANANNNGWSSSAASHTTSSTHSSPAGSGYYSSSANNG